jgi:hypothetical protein
MQQLFAAIDPSKLALGRLTSIRRTTGDLMSVVAELFSIVIRREAVIRSYPGGVVQYAKDCPNSTYCHDDHLTCIGFMSQDDAVRFADGVMRHGISAEEIALVDQNRGLVTPRDWAECAKHKDGWAVCWLKGTDRNRVSAPAGWTTEGARNRQQTLSFMPTSKLNERLEFVRNENNVDVYRDRTTGQLQYVGRPGSSQDKTQPLWKRLLGRS